MWATNKYFWCPVGDRLFAGAVLIKAEGLAAMDSYLLSLILKTDGSYVFVDEGHARNARVLCEEY
jgi:hypothetical protein